MLTTALIAGDQVILHILKKAGLLNREIKVGPPPGPGACRHTHTHTHTHPVAASPHFSTLLPYARSVPTSVL